MMCFLMPIVRLDAILRFDVYDVVLFLDGIFEHSDAFHAVDVHLVNPDVDLMLVIPFWMYIRLLAPIIVAGK